MEMSPTGKSITTSIKEPNEVYVYKKFYYKFVNYSKAFTLFLYF